MRWSRGILTMFGALVAAMSLGAACPVAVEGALLAADRQFAAEVEREGLAGWMKYFAEDARGLAPDDREMVGKAALARYYSAAFADPAAIPRWKPMRADCSEDGSLGYTYGTWRSQLADGPQGQYITLWRKQRSGDWKVAFDLGNFRPAGP